MKKGSSKSIRAMLKNIADKENIDFQVVITRYFHERLLYRIANSFYSTNFFLKGGTLLYAMEGLHIRPTIDIDMLAKQINNNKQQIEVISLYNYLSFIHLGNETHTSKAIARFFPIRSTKTKTA